MKENFISPLPPIWVANLARSRERREFMQQQFESMNLSYSIINAIDGQKLSQPELQEYSKRQAVKEKGRELSTGEIGCALTHAKMCQQMLDDNLDEVLILEDDIVITQDLLNVLLRRRSFPPDIRMIDWDSAIPRAAMTQKSLHKQKAARR